MPREVSWSDLITESSNGRQTKLWVLYCSTKIALTQRLGGRGGERLVSNSACRLWSFSADHLVAVWQLCGYLSLSLRDHGVVQSTTAAVHHTVTKTVLDCLTVLLSEMSHCLSRSAVTLTLPAH